MSKKSEIDKKAETYQEKAHEAGVKVRQVIDGVTGEITEITEVVEGRIESKPVEASLIALGIGLALGLLFGRL